MSIENELSLLGRRVRDKITQTEGVITSVAFDVSGCIQGLVVRGNGPDGKSLDPGWYDTKRLQVLSDPIVPQPTFVQVPGGQELPIPAGNPAK